MRMYVASIFYEYVLKKKKMLFQIINDLFLIDISYSRVYDIGSKISASL